MQEPINFNTLEKLLSSAINEEKSPFVFIREIGADPLKPSFELSYRANSGIFTAESSVDLVNNVQEMVDPSSFGFVGSGVGTPAFVKAGLIGLLAQRVEKAGFQLIAGRAYDRDGVPAEVIGRDVCCNFGEYDFQKIRQMFQQASEKASLWEYARHLGAKNFIVYLMYSHSDPDFLRLSGDTRTAFFDALKNILKPESQFIREMRDDTLEIQQDLCRGLGISQEPSYVPDQSLLAREIQAGQDVPFLGRYLKLLKHYDAEGIIDFKCEVMEGEVKTFSPDFSPFARGQFKPNVSNMGDYLRIHMGLEVEGSYLGLEGNDEFNQLALKTARKILLANGFQTHDNGTFFNESLLAKRPKL